MVSITVNQPQPVQVKALQVGPQGPAAPNGATLASNEFTGAQILKNNDLETAKTITFNGEYDNGASGTGNITINWENGQFQRVELTGNCTITINSPIGVCHNQLRLIQNATGGYTVTWVGLSSTRWMGSAIVPNINSNANGETVINMFFDGSNFLQSMGRIGTS
jgi:hypothetical protein